MGPRGRAATGRLLYRGLPLVVPVTLVAVAVAFSTVAVVTPGAEETVAPAREERARPLPAKPTPVPPPAAKAVAADPARGAVRPAPVRAALPAPGTEMKAAAPAPRLAPPAPAATGSIVGVGAKLLLGAILLAGLLFAAARYAKRLPLGRFLPSADGPIKVIGRSHLGPKGSLALIQVGSTALLVGITQTSVQTLHVFPEGYAAARTGSFGVSSRESAGAGGEANALT
ncbi:MAG: flagellar biosynthetic protein FliO [Candidatus Rokubacteria bacterium]|nr:flagellar biosynthetic protein FliO [Candidatus Rokubacteria bacterium]